MVSSELTEAFLLDDRDYLRARLDETEFRIRLLREKEKGKEVKIEKYQWNTWNIWKFTQTFSGVVQRGSQTIIYDKIPMPELFVDTFFKRNPLFNLRNRISKFLDWLCSDALPPECLREKK